MCFIDDLLLQWFEDEQLVNWIGDQVNSIKVDEIVGKGVVGQVEVVKQVLCQIVW